MILTVGNDQILEDLGSTNGTLVNGEKVQRHILQNGDVIEVGRYKLRFVNAKAMPDMDYDKTLIIPAYDRTKLRQEGVVKDEEDTQSISTAAANARNVKTISPLGAVRGISGDHSGQEIELSRSITAFGMQDNSAIITRRPIGYFITHVVGKKHPIVNGKAISDDPYPLDNLDQIEVGVDKLQFYLK